MSIQVSILPSVAEMESARGRVHTGREIAAVQLGDLILNANGADDIAALAAALRRLGDELTAAVEVTA